MINIHPNNSSNDLYVISAARASSGSDAIAGIYKFVQNVEIANRQPIIEQNLERSIFHLQAPNQLDLFKDSLFAKATDTSNYSAQYTTCGWVAAYLVDQLCRILYNNLITPKETIQLLLEQLDPDAFIRKSTQFVGDLTAYGGSDDTVEGLLLGKDIYAILNGTKPPCLENVFVIEGAAEEQELKGNHEVLQVFNYAIPFKANYKNPSEFIPLKDAIIDVFCGKKPFIILVSLETFPIGKHFVTYTFRKNSQNFLECLILEGLNEAHRNWVSFDLPHEQGNKRRITTEWIYHELILNAPPSIFPQAEPELQKEV